jgi:hypothetical protein
LLIDTLKARRRGYSERATRKVMNGGGVKASPRQPEESPQELKTREGIEYGRSKPPVFRNGPLLGQGPGGELSGAGNGGATRREAKLGNDRRARLADEESRLGSGENP